MKTLDEVIDCMERCSVLHYFDCNGCPYEDEEADCGCQQEERDTDVLYYLKEYRERLQNIEDMIDRYDIAVKNYQEAVRNCEEAENKYKQKQKAAEDVLWKISSEMNPALTWEELRQMEGRPVWIELQDAVIETIDKAWCLCIHFGKLLEKPEVMWMDCISSNCASYTFMAEDYGKTWQAYRKER